MTCVVCQSEISPGAERYANAWERSRKKFPCCGPTCAEAFKRC